MNSRKQAKQRRNRNRSRQVRKPTLGVERRASFETLEQRMLLAADLGGVDLPVAEGEAFIDTYQAPTIHDAGSGYLSGTALGKTAIEVASDYFQLHASEYGLDAGGLGEYRVLSEYLSAHTRVTHLALQQQHNGIDVFGAVANINMDNDGSVLAVASSFVDDLDNTAETPSAIAVTPRMAISSVIQGLGATLTDNVTMITENTTGEMDFVAAGGGVSSGPISGRSIYLPTTSGVELGWQISFQSSQGPEIYHSLVDATDGSFVLITDGVARASYKVIEFPNVDPIDTGSTLVTDPAAFSASPLGWHDTNGIEGPEFTTTRGNNTHVALGDMQDGFNSINYSPDGGVDLDFDFDLDLTQNVFSQDYQNAILTNAFYVVNTIHDVTYSYGFDEAGGNFQASNYTGADGAGDHVLVHAQDPSEGGAPPGGAFIVVAQPDGQSPRMMLSYESNPVSNAAPLQRDFALSNDVIAHEYAHGLLERLVGGPNYFFNYVLDSQIGAMHEGTGDYFGLMFGMKESSAPGDAVESGKWTGPIFTPLDPNRVDPGSRRSAYSYDMAINPITFDQWNDNDSPLLFGGQTIPNNEVHNAGEIWASTLYDMTWELISKYGGTTGAENFVPGHMEIAFNPDLGDAVSKSAVGAQLNSFPGAPPTGQPDQAIFSSTGPDTLDLETGANNYAFQLVIDGMKLAPAQPSFKEMRDSIMAADIAISGGVNLDVIWKAFARRGLGFSADPFDAGTLALPTSPVPFTPAFDLPTNPADVSGSVFIDANENGIREISESPLANVVIFMDLNRNGTRDRLEPYTLSNDNGDYAFIMYTGGEFIVKAEPVENYLQTEPDVITTSGGEQSDGTHGVFVIEGRSAAGFNFGFIPSAVELGVFGTKYNDLNGNGVQDDVNLEPGLAGVYFYIDLDGDQRIDFGEPAAISDADGNYAISFSKAGNYAVREVQSPGWKTTEPAIGHHDITIISGLPVLGINFGNQAQDDYGDAPTPYPSLKEDGGAVHGILPGFGMGTAPDAENDALNSGSEALGDDSTGIDDEDGISINPDVFGTDQPLVKGLTVSLNVSIANGGYSGGVLQAWIDYNQDGDWDDAGEQILTDQTVVEGSNALTITIPTTATVGLTFARFRYGYERGIGPTGRALVGEVEDHRLLILDDKPIANDDFFQVDQDTSNNQLDVLANDFASSLGPLTIRSIVATPDQGGAVSISADGSQIFYTPSANFSTPPLETFTYQVSDSVSVDCGLTPDRCDTATVQVDVTTTFPNAVAIDDYVDPVEGADVNPPITTIDVLANDIVGANGPLVLIPSGLTQPANGTTQVDVVNNTILYTPNGGFYNLDSFTYTASDTQNNITTANVSVQVSKPLGTCSPDADLANCDNVINFFVETLDPTTGASLTTVDVGQDFTVKVSVQDNRLPADALAGNGIFAGFMDVLYDAGNVQIKPSATPIVFSSFYPNFPQGDATVPGVVNELGALQNGFDPLGGGVIELASMTFVATGAGTATIQLDQADVSPEHDTLVHILNSQPSNDAVVDHTVINFGVVTLLVNSAGAGSGGGGGEGERLDASGDGYVTPMDALQVINDLNFYGARPLAAGAEGEMATPNSRFDVNGDDFISPSDVLAIITYLNNRSDGEGEAADLLSLLAEPVNVVATPEQVRSMMAPVDATSLVSEDRSDAPLVLPVQHAAITELPRQTAIETLTLSRWMTSSSDENVAGDDDLDSVLDSLADDVARQWHG